MEASEFVVPASLEELASRGDVKSRTDVAALSSDEAEELVERA